MRSLIRTNQKEGLHGHVLCGSWFLTVAFGHSSVPLERATNPTNPSPCTSHRCCWEPSTSRQLLSYLQVTGYSFGRRFYPKRLTSSANNRTNTSHCMLCHLVFLVNAAQMTLFSSQWVDRVRIGRSPDLWDPNGPTEFPVNGQPWICIREDTCVCVCMYIHCNCMFNKCCSSAMAFGPKQCWLCCGSAKLVEILRRMLELNTSTSILCQCVMRSGLAFPNRVWVTKGHRYEFALLPMQTHKNKQWTRSEIAG